MTEQLSLLGPSVAKARPRQPSQKEIEDALAWSFLEVRLHVSPQAFREKIVGHERDCCAHVWRNLERVWRDYARKGRAFIEHLGVHPETYGDSTAELIERELVSIREYEATAAKWGGFAEWIGSHEPPPEVLAYDPTRGNVILPEEMARVPLDIAESDPLLQIAMANHNEAGALLALWKDSP